MPAKTETEKPERTIRSVSLPLDLAGRADELAAIEVRTFSSVVELALGEYLDLKQAMEPAKKRCLRTDATIIKSSTEGK